MESFAYLEASARQPVNAAPPESSELKQPLPQQPNTSSLEHSETSLPNELEDSPIATCWI
ncbi:MAG: hypothetical protein AAF289_12190 [Cyanobacteria bacterium P01_A01_bin.135]